MTAPNYTYDKTLPSPYGGNAVALALWKNSVVVGGQFTGFGGDPPGGNPHGGLGAFDINTKAVLPFNPLTGSNQITCLLVAGNTIYVGATNMMTALAGAPAYAMAFDLVSGNRLPWNPDTNGVVYALATDGNDIYLGGSFSNLGGGAYARNSLACVDPITGVPTSNPANTNGAVHGLKWDPITSTLFAVGNFSQANSTGRNNAARFDSAGALLPWNPNIHSQANSVDVDAAAAYVGGFFNQVNGGTTRYNLAVFDLATGTVQAQTFGITAGGEVLFVAKNPANGMLYAGGEFSQIQGYTALLGMIGLDTTTGAIQLPLPRFNAPATGGAFVGNYFLVAGQFSQFFGDISNQQINLASYPYGTLLYRNPGSITGGEALKLIYDPDYPGIFCAGEFTGATGLNGPFSRPSLVAFDLVGNVIPWAPIPEHRWRAPR